MIIAFQAWQWNSRRSVAKPARSELVSGNFASLADGPIADAWARAIKLAPAQHNELRDAQEACSTLLAVVGSGEGKPDGSMLETAELIRSYLAPFVDSVERRMARAELSEKVLIVQDMVRFLGGFAQRARRDMQAGGIDGGGGDSALRAHLAARLFG